MKRLKSLAFALASAALAALVPACSSDPNPIDFINTDRNNSSSGDSYVQISLSPLTTRAAAGATDAEENISTVNIYIFAKNSNDNKYYLETVHLGKTVSGNSLMLQASDGEKTIYAVTANALFTTADGMTLDAFEAQVFDSSLSKLVIGTDLVMVGKTTFTIQKASMLSASKNTISIDLTRLVAKIGVTYKANGNKIPYGDMLFGPEDGSISYLYYSVFQTNNEMCLTSGSVRTEFADVTGGSNSDGVASDGTYDTYTFKNAQEIEAASYTEAAAFEASNCLYMPENIVGFPLSGNTTFLCIKVPLAAPIIYNGSDYLSNSDVKTFCVVALANDQTKDILDFYKNKKDEIQCYSNESSANSAVNIAKSLYKDNIPTGYEFQVLTYTDGYAYYRVNIKDVESGRYEIVRNKFYKVDIQSINKLGAPSEDWLRPADASSSLTESSITYSWSNSSFSFIDWASGGNQSENL